MQFLVFTTRTHQWITSASYSPVCATPWLVRNLYAIMINYV